MVAWIVFSREEVATLMTTISKTGLGQKFTLGKRYTAPVTPLEAREAVEVIERAGDQAGGSTAFLGRFRRIAGIDPE